MNFMRGTKNCRDIFHIGIDFSCMHQVIYCSDSYMFGLAVLPYDNKDLVFFSLCAIRVYKLIRKFSFLLACLP